MCEHCALVCRIQLELPQDLIFLSGVQPWTCSPNLLNRLFSQTWLDLAWGTYCSLSSLPLYPAIHNLGICILYWHWRGWHHVALSLMGSWSLAEKNTTEEGWLQLQEAYSSKYLLCYFLQAAISLLTPFHSLWLLSFHFPCLCSCICVIFENQSLLPPASCFSSCLVIWTVRRICHVACQKNTPGSLLGSMA